jgi:hypothetical protein
MDTIFAELGRRLGFGALRLKGSEPLKIEVEGLGAVCFEMGKTQRELMVTLSLPLAPHDRSTLLKAFQACSLEKSASLPFQSGFLNDRLLLMTRHQVGRFDAPMLESLILQLIKLGENLKAA